MEKMSFLQATTAIYLQLNNAGRASNMRDNGMVQATIADEIQCKNMSSMLVISRDQCIRSWTVDLPSVTS